MRNSILLAAIIWFAYSNITAQEHHETPIKKDYYDAIIKHVNRENSLSANLVNLKKECSHYIAVNDTIYTFSDEVILGLYSFTSWPIYWSFTRWLVEGDSIKHAGLILVNYTECYARINKFKFKIKDGHIYWRKKFSFFKSIQGKFPCCMIEDKVKKYIYLRDVMSQSSVRRIEVNSKAEALQRN